MSKKSLDELEDLLDFEHEMKCSVDSCDDPECVFCQKSDSEAAFWDQFYSDPNPTESYYSLHIHQKHTNEDLVFEGNQFFPYTKLKAD